MSEGVAAGIAMHGEEYNKLRGSQ